jgi:hypothetical protein
VEERPAKSRRLQLPLPPPPLLLLLLQLLVQTDPIALQMPAPQDYQW